MLKVGDFIYAYHVNYNRRGVEGMPEHWRKILITGENRASWICGSQKFNKKTLHETHTRGYSGAFGAESEEAMNRMIWRKNNCHRIGSCVSGQSYEIIKQIAELIGYQEQK